MPNRMPKIAPMVLSVAASTRNCDRMSRLRAPSDLRMPISRVRSATATSMMFMMTMAPTTRPMAGSTMPAMTSTFSIFVQNVSADSVVSIEKLSGCAGRSLCRPRMTWRTRSMPSRIPCVEFDLRMTPSITPTAG